jgi:hypothetical protein
MMSGKMKKKYYFWTEGDEGSGDKYYLGSDPNKLIQFLKDNDECLCGADLMTEKEFNRIEKIT